MARFDVFRFASPAAPLVVDVQADLLAGLATRLVIPLSPVELAKAESAPRLKPVLEVAGEKYMLMTTDLAAIPVRALGPFVAKIGEPQRKEIADALDFLFAGF